MRMGSVAPAAIAVIGWCLGATAQPGEATGGPNGKPEVRATIELVDGSRIVGTPRVAALPVKLEFAAFDVPLSLISGCELRQREGVAVVSFTNGDRVTGRIDLREMPLDSSLGRIAPRLDQISRLTFSTLRAGPMPAGNAGIPFGGVNWLTWRTGFELRDRRFSSLPAAREGFHYGHDGHGRGPFLACNVGAAEWRDYRIDVRFCMPGVDPAFDPYGLGRDFRGGMICFHVADAKESHNDRGLSAYCLGVDGDGTWRLETVVNAFCDQPVGFGNPREDSRRRLAEGKGLPIDRAGGNRYSISVSGRRIRILVDDVEIVNLLDDRMAEVIGERTLDHGGVAFVGGFDSMIWIEDFSATAL